MANVNRVVSSASDKHTHPKFGASDCKFGTIGKSSLSEGDLYMWTATSYAINLRTGQGVSRGALENLIITPLLPFTTVELSVNEEQ